MIDRSKLTPPIVDNDEIVVYQARFEADRGQIVRVALTPSSDTRIKEILVDPRRPIPVIFLPGVMGSILMNKDTGEEVWDPPNTDSIVAEIAGLPTVISGWFQSAKTRAERFDPVPAMVDPRGTLIDIDPDKLGFDADEARRRGWATVHRSSYQRVLEWLQIALDKPMYRGVLQGEWIHGSEDGEITALKAILGTHPSEYGGFGEGEALTPDSEVFKTFMKYRYPVYAIGYNFLQSNEQSAKDVLDGVKFEDEDGNRFHVMGIREICRENRTDKAIVITHSMGGLVARMASALCGGSEDILGVVHGVQPATGAPVFAKRFRTGAEGDNFLERLINQFLMGRDAAEFVAVASYAQGPMELAPMPDYMNGEPWWIVVDRKGRERLRMPETNAVNDLYTSGAWYGLLPDPGILDPAGVVRKYLDSIHCKDSVHEHYIKTMKSVGKRQDALTDAYHPNTYALFGSGAISPNEKGEIREKSEAEANLLTFGKVIWQGDIHDGITAEQLKAATLHHDNGKGEMKLQVAGRTVTLRVQNETRALSRKDGYLKDNGVVPGDGTVPYASAEAQARGLIPGVAGERAKGVQMVFRQQGYEHQSSCLHPWSRWATLYSVAQAVYQAKRGNLK